MSGADARALLGRFAGRWRLDRVIEGEGARMQGEARFTPMGPGRLAYREEGRLTLANGTAIEAYRHYLYRADGDRIVIDFADGPDSGKTFVTLRFVEEDGVITARDLHPCGEDLYDVRFTLRSPGSWDTDVPVTGPTKSYRIRTRYERVVR